MVTSLQGIRVLDLSRVLAGPWASQNLADLGAEVIKIESIVTGDDTRTWGPPFLSDRKGNSTSDAAYFLSANRGKKSVTVDIASPEGQELIHRLIKESDILIENFKVDGLAKYELDYLSVRKTNPSLIYCSITGFGQTGPYRNRAGYDFLIQAMGGLMSVTGLPGEEPGGEPMKVGVAITDILTGLYATIAILAALRHRENTGEGQHIDMALLDVQVATLANQASNYLISGETPKRLGNAHPNVVPYQTFPSADGHIVLAIGNNRQFQKFCEVIGRPEMAADGRFRTNEARLLHRQELAAILKSVIGKRSTQDWISMMETAGVPCGPINSIDEVFADPQVKAREMRIEVDHPSGGKIPLVSSPMKFSRTPVVYSHHPPLLGEHTAEVLSALLGLSEERIQTLQEKGIIGTSFFPSGKSAPSEGFLF